MDEIGFADLYEMYEDFKLDRAQTTPADFELYIKSEVLLTELENLQEYVADHHPEIWEAFDSRS